MFLVPFICQFLYQQFVLSVHFDKIHNKFRINNKNNYLILMVIKQRPFEFEGNIGEGLRSQRDFLTSFL